MQTYYRRAGDPRSAPDDERPLPRPNRNEPGAADRSDRTSRREPARARPPGLRPARTRAAGESGSNPWRASSARSSSSSASLHGSSSSPTLARVNARGGRAGGRHWAGHYRRRGLRRGCGRRGRRPGQGGHVEPGELHAEHLHADDHGAQDHGHEHDDGAYQPPPLIRLLDGAADQVHHGECDGGPSDVREHELLLAFTWLLPFPGERPSRNREGKRPSLVSDAPRPVLRGHGPLVSHP